MKNFIDEKGELSFVVGRGFLSLYEAGRLKKGDVIRSHAIAGKPFSAYFNNIYLFSGELCIMDEYLAFRVSGFASCNDAHSKPGVVDYASEILPVEIRLDTLRMSLSELAFAGITTFIALEKKFNGQEDAELHVAGIPLARGKVVVINENFGIRITEVFSSISANIPIRSSGSIVDYDHRRIKDYNFLKPDKFTWESIIKIRSIHKLFLDNLKTLVPAAKNYEILLVDQLAFFELFDDIKKEYSFIIAENKTQSGKYFSGIALGRKSIIEQENSANPVPKEIIELCDLHFQEMKNLKDRKPKALFSIAIKKNSPLAKIKGESAVTELFLNPLKNSWKNITALDLTYSRETDNFEDSKIMPDFDMILRVDFGTKQPECIIIYPFITIESVLPLLD